MIAPCLARLYSSFKPSIISPAFLDALSIAKRLATTSQVKLSLVAATILPATNSSITASRTVLSSGSYIISAFDFLSVLAELSV